MIVRAVLVVVALAVVPLLAACDGSTPEIITCPPSDAVVTVQDSSVGIGQAATPFSNVRVMYVGRRASDGVVFDSSAVPVTFNLGGVIAGFRQGIGGRAATDDAPAIAPMRVGNIDGTGRGRRRIFIPTAFGYGGVPRDGIPACSDLIFDVELIDLP